MLGFGNCAANALAVMRKEKLVYKDYLPPEAVQTGGELVRYLEGLWPELHRKIQKLILEELPEDAPHAAVWWYSVLIGIEKNEEIFEDCVRYVNCHRDVFSLNTQYFLYQQLMEKALKSYKGENQELRELYTKIIDEYAKQIAPELLRELPEQERKKDVVVVITKQFTDDQNSLSKTALECCRTLITESGKEVFLVNDAEMLSQEGAIPFYGNIRGEYIQEKRSEICQYCGDVRIPYFQCGNNMPNIKDVSELLRQIRSIAPEIIIEIGDGGILANIASKIVPVKTVGVSEDNI